MDTVLISGGTSGIGLATAAVLLDRGWNVALNIKGPAGPSQESQGSLPLFLMTAADGDVPAPVQ